MSLAPYTQSSAPTVRRVALALLRTLSLRPLRFWVQILITIFCLCVRYSCFLLFCFALLCMWSWIAWCSLCSPGQLWTHGNPPVSAFLRLWLLRYATKPRTPTPFHFFSGSDPTKGYTHVRQALCDQATLLAPSSPFLNLRLSPQGKILKCIFTNIYICLYHPSFYNGFWELTSDSKKWKETGHISTFHNLEN